MWSLRDLKGIESLQLTTHLTDLVETFGCHITVECGVRGGGCRARCRARRA